MSRAVPSTCPPWCHQRHGELAGEEDTVHVSQRRTVGSTTVLLCAAASADTGDQDGPYVLVGEDEFSLPQTRALVEALLSAIALAAGPTPPEGA